MGLVLHTGAEPATRQEIADVVTPDPLNKWFPIPHATLITRAESALAAVNLEVTKETHGLWKDGLRYFGVLELKSNQSDYSTIVGLRNSHDRSFSAGLACGSHVLCCDNLSFTGEIVIGRKHTTNILADLERLVMEAVGRLTEIKVQQETRIRAYKLHKVSNKAADHLIMQGFRSKVINVQRIAKVNQAWYEPEHDEFKPRNVWSLFNAFTGTLNGQALNNYKVTPRLHGMMDNYAGIAA